jgi:hypothetical protein
MAGEHSSQLGEEVKGAAKNDTQPSRFAVVVEHRPPLGILLP